MNRVCLGLFDSGLGGLTVLRSILRRHGSVPIVYLGDTCLLYTSDAADE